jgi:hypothetical protein
MHQFLHLSDRITMLPVIHGSGDFAVEVRRVMLSGEWDCLAVPLPESFRGDVERAIESLPTITAVLQEEGGSPFDPSRDWTPETDADEDDDDRLRVFSYVPIDPCQPVIAALRIAVQEHLPRAYVDLEVEQFDSRGAALPDPYALKRLPVEQFAAGVLPGIGPLAEGQPRQRVAMMASRLIELEQRFERVLLVCSMLDWPWIKAAYDALRRPSSANPPPEVPEHEPVEPTAICAVHEPTLLFLLGELPYITGLYERARAELDDDENLSIDGLKQLLLATRQHYEAELGKRARKITPHLLRTYLKYVRNLSLVHRRLTPDFYTLVIAAQQLAGDEFAIHLTELVREYPAFDIADSGSDDARDPHPVSRSPYPVLDMGIERAELPDGQVARMKSRLPGPPVTWGRVQLTRRPPKLDQQQYAMRWDPFRQCSWPPEDQKIERFRSHVKDHALSLMGQDLALTEKFSTSLKDGLDIRETLRNWHTGDLYVKVFPPTTGSLDCVVMLFDSPADPRDYPWRITWHAEHQDESTLSLFATDFHNEMVGPGIALATYGGTMFLFPPRPIPDIWQDPTFDAADTLEERLLLAACHHARERHIALLSHAPPGIAWRRIARRFNKRLVHVPLRHFSQETVAQLRMFHVLNGQQVRSYAENFIRKA